MYAMHPPKTAVIADEMASPNEITLTISQRVIAVDYLN
jgi:hypothetical protein